MVWEGFLEIQPLFEVSNLDLFLNSEEVLFHAPNFTCIFWASLYVVLEDDELYSHVGSCTLLDTNHFIAMAFYIDVNGISLAKLKEEHTKFEVCKALNIIEDDSALHL